MNDQQQIRADALTDERRNGTGAEVAQWQMRLKGRSSPVVDRWVNISPDGAKTLMEKYSDVYEVRALYTAPRSPAVAAEAVAIPAGWKLVRVNEHFDALIAALERAESKGYLPDSMREEWENFACDENVTQPAQADAPAEATPIAYDGLTEEFADEVARLANDAPGIREAVAGALATCGAVIVPADAPAEAREPAKVDTKARMDWAAGILRKLPPLDPTYSIISILDDHDREDRDEVLHSIRVFADMRATQALFTLYRAPADAGEARLTDEPSLTNPLTPYGMLVRALRIVSGTTLMDMAKALLTTPAKLSAMEFGRTPVTPEFAFDVSAYFDALGVPCTEYALRAAARAQGGES
ncbi:XRE family transcriptional regulator [Burkholderia multivorans]|uniref:XRE family transcriptional regulator n=1 Tax=Burkholderia multivorans TaxID=87883 RepID=UPI0020B1E4E2|nr:XRE family transcriptional regulator [Burkholderia multivorans]